MAKRKQRFTMISSGIGKDVAVAPEDHSVKPKGWQGRWQSGWQESSSAPIPANFCPVAEGYDAGQPNAPLAEQEPSFYGPDGSGPYFLPSGATPLVEQYPVNLPSEFTDFVAKANAQSAYAAAANAQAEAQTEAAIVQNAHLVEMLTFAAKQATESQNRLNEALAKAIQDLDEEVSDPSESPTARPRGRHRFDALEL